MAWLSADKTVSPTILTATDCLSAQLSMREGQAGQEAGGSWAASEQAAEQHARALGEAVRTAVSPPDRRSATVMRRPDGALGRPSSMTGLVPEAEADRAPRAAT